MTNQFDPTLVGQRIFEARKKRKMTQEALGLELELSGASPISFWESGTNMPGTEALYKLSRALREPVDWLLGLPPHHPRRERNGSK